MTKRKKRVKPLLLFKYGGNAMVNEDLKVKLDMLVGKFNAKAWGTDLSTDYVLFNSVYTT
jgi:glutamate N-acetyltransferase/amino-acid N-acetyltransferase